VRISIQISSGGMVTEAGRGPGPCGDRGLWPEIHAKKGPESNALRTLQKRQITKKQTCAEAVLQLAGAASPSAAAGSSAGAASVVASAAGSAVPVATSPPSSPPPMN